MRSKERAIAAGCRWLQMQKIWATALLPVACFLLFAASAAAGEESSSIAVEVQNVGDAGGSVETTELEGTDE